MLHPGALIADQALDAAIETGAASEIDLVAAAGDPDQAFLRSAWYAAAPRAADITLVGRRAAEPFAALPLTRRGWGPLSIPEIAGSYWPYRSFPISVGTEEGALADLLSSPEAHKALGRAWRIGPIYASDPIAGLLEEAAGRSGWTVLKRPVGTAFVVDFQALAEAGDWPSTKTLRKNRWLERRLATSGELEFRRIEGSAWSSGIFDMLATIESESWVGRQAGSPDTKFLHAPNRRQWEQAIADPVLAGQLGCSLLLVGGAPAAFTFMLRSGNSLHIIANSYCERFSEGSPGRILLYRDLEAARASGISLVGWGAGDPGYKSEMGARPGPEIQDWLIVRGRLLSVLAKPLWGKGASR